MVDLRDLREGDEGTSPSRLFNPFKTLGLVSNHVPCVLRYIHKRRENFIVTSTGSSFLTFVGQQLKLISGSEGQSEGISALASDTYHIYTGVAGTGKVHAWRRGTELTHTYSTNRVDGCVEHIIPFGANLLTVDDKGALAIFDIKSEEMIREIDGISSTQGISSIMHPLTFQNKILIGTTDGFLQLWNINSVRIIHQFDRFQGKSINTLVQAPARGVVALGLSSNEVVLFNIEYDVVLLSLSCMEEPSSIAFRTDGQPVIIVGGVGGSVTAFDLNNGQIISFVKTAHKAPVSGLVAFMGEPIFVSSSGDNALKAWIFDKPDGGFRLLNSREGHFKPPTMARFHGEQSPVIISTGEDGSLRTFHLFNETYNRVMANFEKDNQINSFFNCGGVHAPLGEDVVAFNKYQHGELLTLSYENCKLGKSISPGNKDSVISCALITMDQQWVLIGLKEGSVELYNLQSKRLRNSFKTMKELEVSGLALSGTESTLVIGTVGYLEFHNFPKSTSPLKKLQMKYPVRKLFSRPASNLVGVILADFSIFVVDAASRQIIRELVGCSQPITDAAFSPDMKWVSAASDDGNIRSWDVPTGNLIDEFVALGSCVTSLDYSPRGEFLVTTSAFEVGITLWINKTTYDYVSLLPLSNEGSLKDVEMLKEIESPAEEEQQGEPLSLGKFPKFHWKELLNLSTIKARNKPGAAFKPKVVLPFLLSELDKAKTRDLAETGSTQEPIKSLTFGMANLSLILSPFGKKLIDLHDHQDSKTCDDLIATLVELGPSQIDFELRSWDPQCGGSIKLLQNFLLLVLNCLERGKHLQICQTVLALFLKLYHQKLGKDDTCCELFPKLLTALGGERGDLMKSLTSIDALGDFDSDALY